MNTASTLTPSRPSRLIALVVMLASAGALLTVTSEAEARQRNISFTGPNGKTAERSVTRSGGDVSSSTTGPNGKTASRVVDRSPGSTTATLTGFNGKTATRDTTYNAAGSKTVVTGPNGKTGTRVVTRQP